MRIVRYFLLAVALFSASNALAQAALCGSTGYPGYVTSPSAPGAVGFLNLLPASPDSSTPLTLQVGAMSYVPHSAASSVHAHTIDVTLNASYNGIGIPPPIECLSTALGILAAGPYTINFQLVDADFPSSPPTLFTAQIVVGGGSSALAAPVASPGVLALLGLLLGLVSVRWMRAGR